ncbi:MAG: chorismate mutase, partial [Bacteroidaceae bacterium]
TDVLESILTLLVIRETGQHTENLNDLRRQIDACANSFIETLAKRMRISREIGVYKKEHDMTILQPDRYDEIIAKRGVQGMQCGMNSEFVQTVFEAIHEESVAQQASVINK